MPDNRRIGIFGGTFDPLHIAHLVAASWARSECGLDQVYLMVANDPWQKSGSRVVSSPEIRFEAVQAAVADIDGLEASDLEIRLGGESSSYATLTEIQKVEPSATVSLILGSDAAQGLDSWRSADALAEIANIIVVTRPGQNPLQLADRWQFRMLDIPAIDVSSSYLRQRLMSGVSVDQVIPAAALDVYERQGLYS